VSAVAIKRCPYCLHEHHQRRRACSDYCERKIRGHRQSVTYHRRRAVRVLMAEIQTREQYRKRWRAVAMGRDEATNLQTIFGLDLAPPFVHR
jgi:hypothetical protein